MNLHDYLNSPGSLSISELAERIGVKSVAQIRQWQHGYADRLPSPENCVSIEQATTGAVMRWDLRPKDWHLIWPELVGIHGAPDTAAGKVPANQDHAAIKTVAKAPAIEDARGVPHHA